MQNQQELVVGGIYEHYKGKLYRALGMIRHSETLEELVYYETLYDCELGQMWVRPKELFLGTMEIDGKTRPRFQLTDRKPETKYL